MMNLRIAFSLLSAGLVAWPAASLAHHARFVYDSSELVEIQGTVESIFWRNPHIRFGVRTSDEAGGGVVWEMEGGPINALERAGIEAGAIAVGATVTVLGFASRRDDNTMQPVHLAYADGRNVVLSQEWALHFGLLDEPMRAALDPGRVERAIREANGLFRVWVNTGRTQMQVPLPLRPQAQAAKDSWDQPTDDVALRCAQAGMPEAVVSPFPVELEDHGDTIVVRLEEWDNVRTIHMNPRTAPLDPAPSRLGHSVGRWDGRDLVVTTTHINYPFLDDRGTPQSAAVEIVERFAMNDDETRMDWTATVVDPDTFTEPVNLPVMHYEWVPGEQIKPYDCTLAE